MSREKHSSIHLAFIVATVGIVLALGLSIYGVAATPAAAQTLPTATPESDRSTATPRPTGSLALTATPTSAIPTIVGGDEFTPVTPGVPVTIVSSGGRCIAVITGDDITDPGSVGLEEQELEDLVNRDPRYTYIRTCELVYVDSNGQRIPGYRFSGPVEVCFPYTPEDVARAGGDPARLTVVVYDPTTQQWIEVEVILDEANGRVCALVPLAGPLALAIAGQAAGLPNTSGNLADATPVAAAAAPAAAAAAPAVPAAAAAGSESAAPVAASGAAPAAPAGAAPASASESVAAAPVAAAAPAATQETSAGISPNVILLALSVFVILGALVLVLRRNMITRSHAE